MNTPTGGSLVTIDLKPFCADAEHSGFGATTSPQTFGGYTWATDGRILVRVPAVGPDTVTPSTVAGKPGWMTADGKRFPDVAAMPLPSDADVATPSLWFTPWPERDLYRVGYLCGWCENERKVYADHCPHCEGPLGEPQPCPYCADLPTCRPTARCRRA